MTNNIFISNRRRYFEIIAVIFTGFGKFIFMDWLDLRLVYISTACIFWLVYIGYRVRKNKGILNYWGLNTTNFKRSFLELLPVAICFCLLCNYLGNQQGTNILNRNILPILLIYPLWGIIQQFVMIGIIAKNMKDMENVALPNTIIVFITALVFAVVHYPHNLLIIGTLLLALVYTTLYLKGRNLIVMGIYHGWIGAFFFYTILGRDPWEEVFGMFNI